MIYNPNCDGEHCWASIGEVRALPIGDAGNLIVCRACFNYEITFRRKRNRELTPDCHFDIPKWEDLKVYETGN